jgi:putative salt-induced outer membrane protein YdiY
MYRTLALACALLAATFTHADEPDPAVKESEVVAQVEPSVSGWSIRNYEEFKRWKGEFATGLNGASGNTDRFNSRLGFDGRRTGERSDLQLNMTYAKSTANGEEAENKFLSDARNEWKFQESNWRIYLFVSGIYDEFQAWDYRLVDGGGLAYQFFDNDITSLQVRGGGGTSREFGGTDNRFIPEANIGIDLKHQLNERHAITAGNEYFPSFLSIGDFRVNTKAAWEILIDPEWNLGLKLGIMNRYQSRPEGRLPNDLDYFAELVFKF